MLLWWFNQLYYSLSFVLTIWKFKQVARLINADPKEIIFTSGATESNNIAVKGPSRFYKEKKKHIITTTIEHKVNKILILVAIKSFFS